MSANENGVSDEDIRDLGAFARVATPMYWASERATYAKRIEAVCDELLRLRSSPQEEESDIREALRPFAEVATTVPSNWPGQCSLCWDKDENGVWSVSYHRDSEPAGPTIGDYRRAKTALSAIMGFNAPDSPSLPRDVSGDETVTVSRQNLKAVIDYIEDNIDMDAVGDAFGVAVNELSQSLMIECRACSIAGGADRAVFHEPPECPMDSSPSVGASPASGNEREGKVG